MFPTTRTEKNGNLETFFRRWFFQVSAIEGRNDQNQSIFFYVVLNRPNFHFLSPSLLCALYFRIYSSWETVPEMWNTPVHRYKWSGNPYKMWNIQIKPRINLQVGQNLVDHVVILYPNFVLDKPITFNPERDFNLGTLYRYITNGTGKKFWNFGMNHRSIATFTSLFNSHLRYV